MRRLIKNFLLILFIAALVFGFAPQSYAVVPTWDVGLNGPAPQAFGLLGGEEGWLKHKESGWELSDITSISLGSIVSAASAAAKLAASSIFSWDGIAAGLARVFIKQMVADTVTWIREGDLSGGPLFIQDPERYFQNAADQASGVFLAELGEEIAGNPNFFCGPMPRLMLSLRGSRRPFQKRYSCTISQLQNQVTRFYDNFADGGWETFAQLRQTQNSPFGIFLLASAEQERLVSKALGRSQQEAAWGQGLIGIKECAEQAPQDPDLVGPAPCKRFVYKTPGQAVAQRLGHAVGSDFQEIVTVDEMSEVVDAILSRAVTEAIRAIKE